MKKPGRFFVAVALATLAALVPEPRAQEGEDLSVLRGPGFAAPRKALGEQLTKLGLSLLERRTQEIARLAGPDDVRKRQAAVRSRILASIGGLPERTPLNAKVVGALERQGYRVEKVIFESQPGLFVTANLYLPRTGTPPYPAVLFPLGHERGAKAHEAWQRFLITVVRNGFVALAWDPIGQGERVQNFDPDLGDTKLVRSTTEHSVIGIQCLLAGT